MFNDHQEASMPLQPFLLSQTDIDRQLSFFASPAYLIMMTAQTIQTAEVANSKKPKALLQSTWMQYAPCAMPSVNFTKKTDVVRVCIP